MKRSRWGIVGTGIGGLITAYGSISVFINSWRFSPNTCVGPSSVDISQMGFYLLLGFVGTGIILGGLCLMEEENEENEMWNRIYLMEG